jgi:hypothetical protein
MPAETSFWTYLFAVATADAFRRAHFFSYVKANGAYPVALAAADAGFTLE